MEKKKIFIKTPAKLNLSLDVIGNRSDGYHYLKTVMQAVDIFDYIYICVNSFSSKINVFCDNMSIPLGRDNVCYKAADNILHYCSNVNFGIDIFIEKNIPVESGMGGGSSDAAAVILGLNRILGLSLPNEELIKVSAIVGADVPFFINGNISLAEGIGEILTPLDIDLDIFFLIVKPNFGISTAKAFSILDNVHQNVRFDFDDFIYKLKNEYLNSFNNIFNSFEYVVEHSDVKNIKTTMFEFGCLNSLMTGSGSVIFGVFNEYEKAFLCKLDLLKNYDCVKICKPYHLGVTFL